MANVRNDYLGKHKKFRIDSKKLATAFLVSAFIVSVIVFWWLKLVGITVTGEAFCGIDEHTHSEECYVSKVICGLEEIIASTLPSEEVTTEILTTEEATDNTDSQDTLSEESGEVLASTIEETQPDTTEETTTLQVHTHTDECYSKTLSCSIKEHIHTDECFPDKTADVEAVGDWLSTLENVEITNNISENLVGIAMSQMGYEESNKNFEYDNEGDKNGYTRYGEWYGNPYGKWNTMFVAFCLHYSNINNADELKAAGADAMRFAWQGRGVYTSADEYQPQRGDVVFLDNNNDGTADSVAVIMSVIEDGFVVVIGDSDNKVETKNLELSDNIIGYGLTSQLSFAKDMEYKEETTQVEETEPVAEIQTRPMMMATAPEANITYINDLTSVIKDVSFRTLDGEVIDNNSTVYIGQTYVISMEFAEKNTGDEWIQFKHDEDHHLHYQIPENIQCEPIDWQPITAQTENGTIEDVGRYMIRDDGLLIVVFDDDPDTGECFGAMYSNVDFTINFNAKIGTAQSGTTTQVVFNDKINVNLEVDGGAGMKSTKTHGEYNTEDHTLEYTIKVEATHGVVKDLVLDDQIWDTHYTLRDSIVVTDLKGNILDPQPVVSNHPYHNTGADEGFRISGFPDFAAGDGYLITYKTKVYDNMLSNDSVSLWNGLDINGKDSSGNNIYVWAEDWLRVELDKITKDGKQTVLTDANGNTIQAIEWEVAIRKSAADLQGTVIIDTLGEGLSYYTGQPILVKHYDEWGNRLDDIYISWDNVTIEGNTMSFELPYGYTFDMFYYTTFEALDEGEQKHYTNSVEATIDGKHETAGGSADVVSFIPRVSKGASGSDGEYVYFTIEADVPSIIKDWGSFYLTDMAAFWGYDGNDEGYLYVENMPLDLIITAVTESGRTITFTPYVAGGPTENTYIIMAPANGTQHHSFNILFNTSEKNFASSKWVLGENSILKITYKLPFDAKTGTEWEGELKGTKTLEDLLLEGRSFANEVYLNYTDVIQGTASSNYEYAPGIIKDAIIHEDGTIDYKVIFRNTVPGSYGNEGYLNYNTMSAYFTDTFDEKLEYVENSLTVTCYDPWRAGMWLNMYTYNGSITGNTINLHANQFKYAATNPKAAEYDWSGLESLSTLESYYKHTYCGGEYIFTYTLKVKDEYLYSTEHSVYQLDNIAEVLWDNAGTSGPAKETVEFETGLIDKQAAQENNKLNFAIHINRNALDILKGVDTLLIEDTMTQNLSVYWDSIKLYYEDANGNWIDFDSPESTKKCSVTYDQNSNKLTFTVPDELHIKIDYTTLITESGFVSVNNVVSINGSAKVTDFVDATFKVVEHSGGATGSVHNITLLKQDGDTDQRLPGITFHLYGPMGDPSAKLPTGATASIYPDDEKRLGYIGTYTTGPDGTAEIKTQYLTFGGPYALVEVGAPEGYVPLKKPAYFYFYELDPNGIIQTVTTLIAVENYIYGYVLPETGGTGTLPLAIVGFALMAFPILYSMIRRKRERRLN